MVRPPGRPRRGDARPVGRERGEPDRHGVPAQGRPPQAAVQVQADRLAPRHLVNDDEPLAPGVECDRFGGGHPPGIQTALRGPQRAERAGFAPRDVAGAKEDPDLVPAPCVGDRLHAGEVVGSGDRAGLAVVGQVPNPRGPVLRAGDQPVAVGAEGHARDDLGMPADHPGRDPRLDTPDPGGAVAAGRGQVQAVGAEGQPVDPAAVAGQRPSQLSVGEAPEIDLAGPRPAGQDAGIGADGQRQATVLLLGPGHLGARGEVPHLRMPLRAPRDAKECGQPAAVGAEVDTQVAERVGRGRLDPTFRKMSWAKKVRQPSDEKSGRGVEAAVLIVSPSQRRTAWDSSRRWKIPGPR